MPPRRQEPRGQQLELILPVSLGVQVRHLLISQLKALTIGRTATKPLERLPKRRYCSSRDVFGSYMRHRQNTSFGLK